MIPRSRSSFIFTSAVCYYRRIKHVFSVSFCQKQRSYFVHIYFKES
ncbi:hypothetical protein HMPREF1548_02310 [Clostridium sp. KLE 1755]|nr:hypothetical protein HMPREF1548_02310 [Clostridium sp. KLE 1755]